MSDLIIHTTQAHIQVLYLIAEAPLGSHIDGFQNADQGPKLLTPIYCLS